MKRLLKGASKGSSTGACGAPERSNNNGWKIAFAVINNEKWNKLRKMLRSSKASAYCTGSDKTGLTSLSFALGLKPPLDIVELLLKSNPSASMQPDKYGALPIHIACLNGASAPVVKLLIDHDNGSTVTIPDADGRVALHHAVEFSARIFSEGNDDVPVFGSSGSNIETASQGSFGEDLEIVQLLCDTGPDMVHYRNKNNDTAMDVAHVIKIIAKSKKKRARIDLIYDILRETSIKVYVKNKKQWEIAGFDTDAVSLPSLAISTISGASAEDTEYNHERIPDICRNQINEPWPYQFLMSCDYKDDKLEKL